MGFVTCDTRCGPRGSTGATPSQAELGGNPKCDGGTSPMRVTAAASKVESVRDASSELGGS
jgi:hypothetical protein